MRKEDREEVSIAEAVRIIVNQKQALLECLSKKIVNYTWAAQQLLEDVKKITGKKRVGIDAVKAALIRMEQELSREEKAIKERTGCIMANSTLELQDDISVLTMRKYVVEKNIEDILGAAGKARFFNFSQGSRTYTIVVSSESLESIENIAGREGVLDKVSNQSAIVIISPYEIMSTPGVVSYITRLLFQAGVNITQIISCYTDTIIIVSKKDSLKALAVLQEAIERSRIICSKKL